MSLTFHSWQAHPYSSMGQAPYDHFSPNLALVAADMRVRFGATGGSGYVVRPVRAGTKPSSHGFGAAWDGTIVDPDRRAAAIAWLIMNCEALGVQAVHDYVGSRLWRVGRGWQPVTPNAAEGWGQPWAKWLHIETTPDRWNDTRPLAERGIGAAPATPAPAPVQQYAHPTLMVMATKPTDPVVLAATKRVQRAVGVADDGWFGPKTDTAVRDFQRNRGLKADGIVGKNTWAAIEAQLGGA